MARAHVRTLESRDFPALMRLEEDVFAAAGETVLGPYYIRLCCEFFTDSCFVAEVDGEAVGYLLSFVNKGEVYCTTLAVVPRFQGSRVTLELLRAFMRRIVDRVDVCWFTVTEDNVAARGLHAVLGARELEIRSEFYGKGDRRIVSRIDRATFDALRPKYERLGLVERRAPPSGELIPAAPALEVA